MNSKSEEAFRLILMAIGENPNREGLLDTPKRYMKFLEEVCKPVDFNFTTFDAEGANEMIVQLNIPFYSLCEHHTVPFFGVAHLAYVPNKRIAGLSKLARTVEHFSQRLQNQERITGLVAQFLSEKLDTPNVGCVLMARHLCMEMRGVKKPGAFTTTSKMLGAFREDDRVRREFWDRIKNCEL
jgi:GTP cyclohydrolase I